MPTYGLYLADFVRGRTASHGVANYAIGLATALPAALAADERLIVYANTALAAELETVADHPSCTLRVSPPPHLPLDRFRHTQARAPMVAFRDHLDVLHFPGAMAPFVRLPGMRTVVTVHDDLPHAYLRGGAAVGLGDEGQHHQRYRAFGRYARFVLRRCRVSDHVIAVSDFTRHQFVTARPGDRIDGERITVIHQGITLPDREFTPIAAREKHVVHFSSHYPHKRSDVAINWALRYADSRGGSPSLVVVGELPEALTHVGGDPRVHHRPGPLTTSEVADLVANAQAVVFASTYEGFGLPPVEAYALGTPATWAWSSASREAMGDAPGGHDPDDFDGFQRAMDRVLALDDANLTVLQEATRRTYDWGHAARATAAVYQSVAGTRSRRR